MSFANHRTAASNTLAGRRPGLMKERAYTELKRLILSEKVEPGAFLSERQLAARLQMSKTPVKAALERLEAEGFIGVSPQQGIVVQDLSLEEIADHFEIREMLEIFVVRRLAGRLTAEQRTRVQANLTAQSAAAKRRDVPTSGSLDSEFHLLWCEFLGNHEIIEIMRRQRDRIHRIIARVNARNPDRLDASYSEHARIAQAIFAGDGDLAAACIQEHLNYGKQFLLAPRRP